jgi:hypothetical protein
MPGFDGYVVDVLEAGSPAEEFPQLGRKSFVRASKPYNEIMIAVSHGLTPHSRAILSG